MKLPKISKAELFKILDPKNKKTLHPGEVLQKIFNFLDINYKDVAIKMKVWPLYLHEIIEKVRDINEEDDKQLSRILGIPRGFLMNMQAEYDEFKHQEYKNMITSVVDEKPAAKTITIGPFDVDLVLKKPDLLGKSKWEFTYTKKIEVKIDDEGFLAKVRKGEIKNLYAGVRIPCILQFEYKLDEYHDIVPNSDKYTILAITGDIIEPERDNKTSLFDNNS